MLLGQSVSKNSLALGLFAIFTATILAITNLATQDRIIEQERRAQEKALIEIVPKNRHNNNMLDDTIPIQEKDFSALGLKDEENSIYIARQNGNPVAVIIPAIAPDGYNGDIRIIVGINLEDGTIAGVRAISHKETPGLGDKIDKSKSNWIDSFTGKSLRNPESSKWKVKKDKGVFDQFTGATITPRAVVKQVYKTLQYYEESKETFFPENFEHQPTQ
jgi:electron transport complex protein RnfG